MHSIIIQCNRRYQYQYDVGRVSKVTLLLKQRIWMVVQTCVKRMRYPTGLRIMVSEWSRGWLPR